MEEEEINLIDYWRVIVRWRKAIFLLVSAVTLFSVIVSLLMTKVYKAEATLMPVGGQKGGFSLAAAQMGLGGLLGGLGGDSTPSAQLLAILRSRTLAEMMIEKYDLMKVLYDKLWDEQQQRWKIEDPREMPNMEGAVKNLLKVVSFSEDRKNQLITISAMYKDPVFVADVINRYIEELIAYLNENSFTVAKRNRLFIEEQLEKNDKEILESGKELAEFYATNKISNIVPTVDVDVAVKGSPEGEEVVGRMAGGEKDAFANQRVAQDTNLAQGKDSGGLPGVPDALAEDQKKTEVLEEKAEALEAQVRRAKVVKDVPQQVYLQYLTLRREILGQLNTLLTQQYELAKIDEAKEDLNFQVIDWARVPVRRLKPKRRQIVMSAFVVSLFLAVFFAFCMDYLEKMRAKARGSNP